MPHKSDDLNITADGNVGIGSTTPIVKLDVNGSIKGVITLGTAVAATSGTAIHFTGIPSWAKRISIIFNAVSTTGISTVQVQVGTGETVVNSGYYSYYACMAPNGTDSGSLGSGFGIFTDAGTQKKYVIMTLANISENTWVSAHYGAYFATGQAGLCGGGSIVMGGVLDRVRITTVNGSDTFDNGTINIMYEG